MNWTKFLTYICQEYDLTPPQTEILLCLKEDENPTKQGLRKACSTDIGEEAFTQRLRNIYKEFDITDRGPRLPKLYRIIKDKYEEYELPNRSKLRGITSLRLSHFVVRLHSTAPVRKLFLQIAASCGVCIPQN
jgi:hypothetical protein